MSAPLHRLPRPLISQWAACLLLATMSCPVIARADDRPRLVIVPLNEIRYSGAERLQAGVVNQFFLDLGNLLPEIDVSRTAKPDEGSDYYLVLLSLRSTNTYLEVRAEYGIKGEETRKETGRFVEPCTPTHRKAQRCEPASRQYRAEHVIGDLLEKTILSGTDGIYKPLGVDRCDELRPIGVAIQISSSSDVSFYAEPSKLLDYEPGILQKALDDEYLVPKPFLLRRNQKLSSGYAFARLWGDQDQLAELCHSKGWVLVHRYQYPEQTISDGGVDLAHPTAINSAPPRGTEP